MPGTGTKIDSEIWEPNDKHSDIRANNLQQRRSEHEVK